MSDKSSLRTGALLCFLAIILLITSIPASAGSPCDKVTAQAQAWLKSTIWRPAHPEDLKAVPAQYRSAVLSLLPAEVRSNLWREFFESYIVGHRDLTGDQVRVLNSAIDLASPEFFAVRPGNPQWAEKVDGPTKELVRQARKVFTPSAFQEILVDMDKVLATPDPGTDPTPIYACNCVIALGNCSLGGHTGPCQASSCLTSQTCGTMRNQNCDGLCNFAAPPTGTGTLDP